MKTYIKENKKGLLIIISGFILLIIMIIIHNIKIKNELRVNKFNIFNSDIIETRSNNNLTAEDILSMFLASRKDKIQFFADTFQIEYETLIKYLKEYAEEIDIVNDEEFEYNLIEFLFTLEDEQKELFKSKVEVSEKNKEYMISLIKYYCNIYKSVDFKIATAIAQVESGYSSKSMLNKNNIFGGMSNKKLIKYKNIEYGILSYIRLLNNNYFEKGLMTVEDIGKKYNPIYNETGQKVANPRWVINVKNAMNDFNIEDYDLIFE